MPREHILVDKRNRQYMESHFWLDALLRSDPIRSLSTEHSRAVQRQIDRVFAASLLSDMHDPVVRVSHVLVSKREGLLVLPILRLIRHCSEHAVDIHVGGLLCLLVSQGAAAVLPHDRARDLHFRDDTANTEAEHQQQH